MYPFDYEKDRPIASQNGKYMFRLNFNGCFRQVVIDDRLPASRSSRTFFVVDRRNPELIWPALIEKAYLKIRGGYDFPGSNSGTDLWVLTGWIPERVVLQRWARSVVVVVAVCQKQSILLKKNQKKKTVRVFQ